MLLLIPAVEFDCIVIGIVKQTRTRLILLGLLYGAVLFAEKLGAYLHKSLLINAFIEHYHLILHGSKIISIYSQLK
jgi:hypothetical protein